MSTLPKWPECSSELVYENGRMYACPECVHDIDRKNDGIGAMQMKSEFVNKT